MNLQPKFCLERWFQSGTQYSHQTGCKDWNLQRMVLILKNKLSELNTIFKNSWLSRKRWCSLISFGPGWIELTLKNLNNWNNLYTEQIWTLKTIWTIFNTETRKCNMQYLRRHNCYDALKVPRKTHLVIRIKKKTTKNKFFNWKSGATSKLKTNRNYFVYERGCSLLNDLLFFTKVWLFLSTLLFKTLKNFSVKSRTLMREQPLSYTK